VEKKKEERTKLKRHEQVRNEKKKKKKREKPYELKAKLLRLLIKFNSTCIQNNIIEFDYVV
jgi:hypothetical protein